MHSSTQNESLFCEQCGAPLKRWGDEEGCLNCLLGTGLEVERAEDFTPPNEPGTRFFQHYEILTRPDGLCWELGRGAMGVTYKARDVNLDTRSRSRLSTPDFPLGPERAAVSCMRPGWPHDSPSERHQCISLGTSNASPAPNDEPIGMSAKVESRLLLCDGIVHRRGIARAHAPATQRAASACLSCLRLRRRSHVRWPPPRTCPLAPSGLKAGEYHARCGRGNYGRECSSR